MNKTTGTLITVGNVSVRIYEAPDNGTAAHTETFTNVITNGTFSVQVGNSTTLNLTYNRIYWLEIDVNGEEVVGNATGASGRRAFISTAGPDATILIANDTSRNVGVNITNPGGIFQVSAGGTSTALFVNGTTGYVGIGTAGPNTNLNVVGSVNISGTINGTWNGNTIATNYLNVNGIQQANLTGLTIPAANVSAGTFASGLFTFQNNLTVAQNLTAGNTLWVDSALRKVGINTTTPSGLLQVSVNGTAAAFFINETGNIGIGTASPAQTLTVAGTGNFTSTLWAGSTITGINGLTISAGTISLPANSISQNTLAGISGIPQANLTGITLPAANVSAGTFASGLFTFQNNLTVAQNLTAGNTLWVDSAVRKVGINTTSPSGILQVSVNGTAAAFFINETGNVGIGTASPAQTLTVVGTANVTGALIAHNTKCTSEQVISTTADGTLQCVTDQTGGAGVTLPAANVTSGTFPAGNFIFTGGSGNIFNVNSSFYVNGTTGNVGIGATAPGALLDVAGTTLTGAGVLTLEAGGELTTASGNDLNINVPTARSLFIKLAGATKVTMDNAGNVGIGTTGPLQTLTVAGTANVTSTLTITSTDYKTQTLTDGATISWDASAGDIATVTLGGNRAMAAPTNLKKTTYILHVIQDGTGSRTLTWNSVFKWPSGVAPTLTTTASARDVFSFISDGTNLYGSYILDVK